MSALHLLKKITKKHWPSISSKVKRLTFFSILILLFISCIKEEQDCQVNYIIRNQTNHFITLPYHVPRKEITIEAGKTVTDIQYAKGCGNSLSKFFYISDGKVEVIFDDSILIFHLSRSDSTSALRPINVDSNWVSVNGAECVYYNTYTFTEADYKEALAKHR